MSEIFKDYRSVAQEKMLKYAKNALTLQWVHEDLRVLPEEEIIFKPELFNHQDFVDTALEYEQWEVVEFFIEHFPHLLKLNEMIFIGENSSFCMLSCTRPIKSSKALV